MANIRVQLDCEIFDGQPVTFVAPCDCTEITGLKVIYPGDFKIFTFKDAHRNDLTGLGNLFSEGAIVKAILDVSNGYAYLQNADTNAYIEKNYFRYKSGLNGDIDSRGLNGVYWIDKTKCTGTFPDGWGNYGYLDACGLSSSAYQRLIKYTSNGVSAIYERYYTNSKWYPWVRVDSLNAATTEYVDSALEEKQDAITGLAKSKVMICNSSGVITTSSTVTTTELNYLGGVQSKIQTQLNGKIGKFTLVWTNESPGSSFGKQNISVNYSSYTHLLYVFRGSTSANGAFFDSTLVPASIQTNLHTMVEYLPGFRSVTPASNNLLSFGEGHILNGTTQQSNNNYIIPYKIYGCNLA